jgi:hypothetical protein
MKNNWQTYFSQKNKTLIFIGSICSLAITLFTFLHFLTYNEFRRGYTFNDPVLNLFTPIDVSIVTFITTYSLAIVGLIFSLTQPSLFIKLIQGYTILTVLRMLCLYMVPLEAPHAIIPLQDIFLHASFYSGRANLKDLFFSGHTAILFLFAYCFTNKKLKTVYIIGGIIVGSLVMLQHVHYSIDVVAAPLFGYAAYVLQRRLNLQ